MTARTLSREVSAPRRPREPAMSAQEGVATASSTSTSSAAPNARIKSSPTVTSASATDDDDRPEPIVAERRYGSRHVEATVTGAASLIAGAFLLAAGIAGGRPGVGDAAPALELETIDGKVFRQSQLAGQVTVVDFFATWCQPCHQARRDLARIHAELGPRIHIVLVDVNEDLALV